jgi:hypothetical protein
LFLGWLRSIAFQGTGFFEYYRVFEVCLILLNKGGVGDYEPLSRAQQKLRVGFFGSQTQKI